MTNHGDSLLNTERGRRARVRIAVYGGTFDPITNGHLDVIDRAIGLFDHLIVAVASATHKTNHMFSLDQRLSFVLAALDALDPNKQKNVSAEVLDGLLVDFADQHKATVLVRGLRVVGDFEYEFQMASVNRQLNRKIETVFLHANDSVHYLASRMVRDVLQNGGDGSLFMPDSVYRLVCETLCSQGFRRDVRVSGGSAQS